METIGNEVRRELGRFGPQAGMADVLAAWPAAVGAEIARNACPARIGRDGTLHVHTADAVWAFELGHRAAEIAPRLGVTAVRFAPGPLPAGPETGSGERPRDLVEPGPRERELAEAIAAAVGDEELRERVARAAALSLARGSSGRAV
jgi:hypothetical protein